MCCGAAGARFWEWGLFASPAVPRGVASPTPVSPDGAGGWCGCNAPVHRAEALGSASAVCRCKCPARANRPSGLAITVSCGQTPTACWSTCASRPMHCFRPLHTCKSASKWARDNVQITHRLPSPALAAACSFAALVPPKSCLNEELWETCGRASSPTRWGTGGTHPQPPYV